MAGLLWCSAYQTRSNPLRSAACASSTEPASASPISCERPTVARSSRESTGDMGVLSRQDVTEVATAHAHPGNAVEPRKIPRLAHRSLPVPDRQATPPISAPRPQSRLPGPNPRSEHPKVVSVGAQHPPLLDVRRRVGARPRAPPLHAPPGSPGALRPEPAGDE